jgi:hypothetical protein
MDLSVMTGEETADYADVTDKTREGRPRPREAENRNLAYLRTKPTAVMSSKVETSLNIYAGKRFLDFARNDR